MPAPDFNVKVTWKFQLRLGSADTEIAEIGVWGIAEDSPIAGSDWNTYLTALATRAAANWSSNVTAGNYSSHLRFGTCIATHYGLDGKTAYEQSVVHTPTWVGSGGNSLPWQCAQVVGLYSYTPGTFIANARRRRGRVYLPGLSTSVLNSDGSGLMTDAAATAQMTDFNALLKSLHHTPIVGSFAFIPAVYSRVANHLYPITDVTTDVKVDTQRRRTHQFSVNRITAQYTGP